MDGLACTLTIQIFDHSKSALCNLRRPDLIGFLEDEEMSELIILLLQAKTKPTLDTITWDNTLESITPKFFYTITVCTRHIAPYPNADLPQLVLSESFATELTSAE